MSKGVAPGGVQVQYLDGKQVAFSEEVSIQLSGLCLREHLVEEILLLPVGKTIGKRN